MSKAKAIRSQLPAQPSDAAPPPTAGTSPPPDPPPPDGDQGGNSNAGERPEVVVGIRRLTVAQALPEVDGDASTLPVVFEPGSIERFKSDDNDRRTMTIVALPDGSLAKRVAPETQES